MPRRKNKKRGQRGKRRGRAAGIRATGSLPAASSPVDPSKLHTILRSVATMQVLLEKERQWKEARRSETPLSLLGLSTAHTATNPLGELGPAEEAKKPVEVKTAKTLDLQEVKTAWSDIEDSDSDESPFIQSPVVELRAMRGLFKADIPYRCRLGIMGSLATNAAGVLNTSTAAASVSSTGEWSAIDQLFDEVFIHSFTLRFHPTNVAAGGYGTVAAGGYNTISAGGTGGEIKVVNGGAMIVSLFNGASTYSTQAAMLPNPTHKTITVYKPWVYVWRNNTRFDRRGLVAQNTAWQGWTLIGNVTNYGGTTQIRALNDNQMGDGTNIHTFGDLQIIYDVSFRARA